MTTPYQWLLFDADDTLFDYQKAEGLALAQSFERAAIPFSPDVLAAYREINHSLWQALERGEITPDVLRVRRFELLFEAIQQKHSAGEFSEVYIACLTTCAELIDGAEEVLRSLQGRYRFAILTNGLSAVQRGRLARSPIRDMIEAIIISGEVGFAKPSAEYFDAAFAQLGSPSKDTALIIGDSLTADIQGGAAYGLDTCWYNPKRQPRPPEMAITYEIADLQELVDLLA